MNIDKMKIHKFKLGLLGASGRMGGEILGLLSKSHFSSRLELVASPGSKDPFDSLFRAEIWVDFSSPSAVLKLCREAVSRKSKIPLVVGTTGWTDVEKIELENAALHFPILRASNFSLGVFLCRIALRSWSSVSEVEKWTVKIRDLHHAAKKDAPSGTALSLRDAIGRADAITSIREGDAVGRHEVELESELEKVVLIHEAKKRSVFAEGALETALRLANSDLKSFPSRILSLDDLYLHRGV
jgi:4-hydroxy-tetrahydrodipicolinate reductase